MKLERRKEVRTEGVEKGLGERGGEKVTRDIKVERGY